MDTTWYNLSYIRYRRKSRRRKCHADLTYHVMSRCIERKNLLKKKKMKNLLIHVIKKAQLKYNFEFIDFVIMNNHFHFMIKTTNDQDTISKIMQFIKSQFARRYNRILDRTGPFWNERFKDSIIEDAEDPEAYANYLNWYFAYNPVKKGYVNKPEDYIYCGIHIYLGKKMPIPIKLTHHKYYLNLGDTQKKRINNFKKYEDILISHL